MTTFYPFGAGTYTLSGSISSTATTINLSSFLEPVTGTPYTMVLLNSDIAFATIAPKTTSSEFISFTGITQNADGTATLTGVTRGLAKKYPFTTDSTYKLPHSGQSQFIISDVPQLFQEYIPLTNDVTITGVKTFATGATPLITDQPTTNLMAANKLYVDTVAIAGAPNSSTTTKGIGKVSVAPVSPTNPIFVGDNDPRLTPIASGTSGGILGFTGASTLTSSVLLTQHALVIGGGAGATPTPLASLGTATTILHGNASGDPTFGAVVLTTDVSGILPVANGGTGAASLPFSGIFKNGQTTYDISTANGTVNIAHGVGATPKKIRLTFIVSGTGTGFSQAFSFFTYNGTTASEIHGALNNATNISSNGTTAILWSAAVNGAFVTATITFDGTNIIMAMVKTGSPTGTAYILWEAEA